MNKIFKTLSLLAMFAFFATACVPQTVDVVQAAPADVGYQATLGKVVSDKTVADFIASNSCSRSGSFQICQSAGVVLWTDADQIVKTAYLYVTESDGFAAYMGELPAGLMSKDTMANVEEKLGQPKDVHALQAGWQPGLPDEGGSPDHFHYWAVYKRFGLTVIYNSPSAGDKNATIHAILVTQ